MRLPQRRSAECGITLVEALAMLLGIGMLVAIAVPLYLGYMRDTRFAEARTIAGSVLAALQSCVQAKAGHASCGLSDVRDRLGVSSGGLSADERWHVTTARLRLIRRDPAVFAGFIAVVGQATDTGGTAMAIFQSAAGTVVRCSTAGGGALTSPSDGQAC